MAAENDANLANETELAAHIILASSRAKAAASPAAAAPLQELEDYYERALQIRVMTNETQREHAREASLNYAATIRQWKLLACVLCGCLVAVVVVCAPGLVDEAYVVLQPYMTADRVVTHIIVSIIMYFILYRSSSASKRDF